VTAPRTVSRPLAAVLAAGALSLLVAGCGVFGPGDRTDSASTPARGSTPVGSAPVTSGASRTAGVPARLRAFYGQRLRWTSCRTHMQCARLRVPLDYARPGGRSIEVALLKVPALDPARRIGSMVVDPGGPGASGVDYAAAAETAFGPRLRQRYDVVGLDPRGVGLSTPIECGSDARLDRLFDYDPDPETAAERRTVDRMFRAVGRGCLRHDPQLLRHVSTGEVARDLDVLRAALGDARLTYFGASYGTAIGTAYAERFPTRVGRMVLDGAMDPRVSTVRLNLVQARGFEDALRSYVGACVDKGGCFLGATVDAGVRTIQALLRRAETSPLRSTSGDPVTAGMVNYGITYPLYAQTLWPLLDRALEQGLRGDGTILALLADAYLHRDQDGHFKDNTFEAYDAVNCLDHDDGIRWDRVDALLPRFERASPTFGSAFASSLPACTDWPVHSGRVGHAVDITGAPPVLVVGTTRDPATPLVWAQALSRQIHGSVLVTRDGDGHTGYQQGNACVDGTVEDYLVRGTVPDEDVSC